MKIKTKFLMNTKHYNNKLNNKIRNQLMLKEYLKNRNNKMKLYRN